MFNVKYYILFTLICNVDRTSVICRPLCCEKCGADVERTNIHGATLYTLAGPKNVCVSDGCCGDDCRYISEFDGIEETYLL